MKAIIQRVVSGSVSVNGELISSIGKGIVALIGIHKDDTKSDLDYIVRKLNLIFILLSVEISKNYSMKSF